MVISLLYELPVPPPGKLQVKVDIGLKSLYYFRPPVNQISIIKNVIRILNSIQCIQSLNVYRLKI